MDGNQSDIVENAAEIIGEAVSDALEDAQENGTGEEGQEVSPEASETPHVVSLEERLSECLQRLAVAEERLSQLSGQAQNAEIAADQAQDLAETAIDIAVQSNQEPEEELSSPEPVELSPPPPEEEPKKKSLLEWILGG